jgi:hypothetical protein
MALAAVSSATPQGTFHSNKLPPRPTTRTPDHRPTACDAILQDAAPTEWDAQLPDPQVSCAILFPLITLCCSGWRAEAFSMLRGASAVVSAVERDARVAGAARSRLESGSRRQRWLRRKARAEDQAAQRCGSLPCCNMQTLSKSKPIEAKLTKQ